MVESLRIIVNEKIKLCKDFEKKERLQIIGKILEDENCFNIMKSETAYKLLNDIGYSEEEVKAIYNKIIFG